MLAASACLGARTGYDKALYSLAIFEPTLTVVLFSALALIAYPAYLALQYRKLPPIHDITTDPDDPPARCHPGGPAEDGPNARRELVRGRVRFFLVRHAQAPLRASGRAAPSDSETAVATDACIWQLGSFSR